jgi:hypothetical protein
MLAVLCVGQSRPSGRGASGRGGTAIDPNAPKGLYPTAHGVIKSISGTQVFVQVDEEHEMKFRITRKTKILLHGKAAKSSSLEPGQTVDIDMQSSLDGSFEAVSIIVAAAKQ